MYQLKFSYRTVILSILSAGLSITSGLAHGQVSSVALEQPHSVESNQLGVGLGVQTENSPYRGAGRDNSVLPLILYENRYIHFFGTTLDVKSPKYGGVGFTLRAKYDDPGYKASDSSFLQGMDKRKGGLWWGATATWDNPFVKTSLEWLTAGNTRGTTVKLGIEHAFVVGDRFKLTPHASSIWMNDKYVNNYFGVKESEATPDRPSYIGKATSNIEIGLRTDYVLTPNQLVVFDLSEILRGSNIKDSPIVDSSSSLRVTVSYLHKF